MGVLGSILGKVVSMIVDIFPTVWRRIRRRFGPPDLHQLQFDAIYADLSDAARIVFAALCDGGLMPQAIAVRLRETRSPANVDTVIQEPTDAGLIEHNFGGTRTIKQDWIALVREAVWRRP